MVDFRPFFRCFRPFFVGSIQTSPPYKSKAIELLGGKVASAAEAIGISYQAVDKWPDALPSRISDRVLAVLARKHLPPEVIGESQTVQAKAA